MQRLFCRRDAITLEIELDNDAMMDEPVDGSGSGHRVFEDEVPF